LRGGLFRFVAARTNGFDKLAENISGTRFLDVFGTASDEGDDGDEHETSGNDKSDRVAVSTVETLKLAQNWRDKS
jgi:hypothetical protein